MVKNKEALTKLIAMLKNAAAVLKHADGELDMSRWFRAKDCGYAACVCGHLAYQGNKDLFGISHDFAMLSAKAQLVAKRLDDTACEALGSLAVATSVHSFSAERRRSAAKTLFTQQEIDAFAFLSFDDDVVIPAASAVEYISAVIVKLKQLEAVNGQ